MRRELEVEVLLEGGDVTDGVMLDEGLSGDRTRYAWVYLASTGRKAWVPMAQVRSGGRIPAPRAEQIEPFPLGTPRH
ncbi:hypothetical protein GCM10009668_19980 [Nocardioides dubius]|uniref:SH3 domain-containing protein n=2 Tax=Nocardioides dubius TaxID=317019 RepID=A0ABP4EDM8_9ACTN